MALAEIGFREYLRAWRGHVWEGKAWEQLGDAYTALAQPKKAADAYAQAATFANSCTDQGSAYFKMGTVFAALENSGRALASFDSAIARGERCAVYLRVPDAYYRKADEQYRGKDYEAALAVYAKALRKYPEFQETPWGLFQIGNCHKALRRHDEAVAAYRDLVKKFPDDYWAKQAQWKIDDTEWERAYQASLQ
jgi:TolA-binding protein